VPRTDPGFVGLEDYTILWSSLQKEYEIMNTKLYIFIIRKYITTNSKFLKKGDTTKITKSRKII
jgi:hypothetical protein